MIGDQPVRAERKLVVVSSHESSEGRRAQKTDMLLLVVHRALHVLHTPLVRLVLSPCCGILMLEILLLETI